VEKLVALTNLPWQNIFFWYFLDEYYIVWFLGKQKGCTDFFMGDGQIVFGESIELPF
jgi:hypothetical protein